MNAIYFASLGPSGTKVGIGCAVLAIGFWWCARRLNSIRSLRTSGDPVDDKTSRNTSSIRQATEHLKSVCDYPEICRVLQLAFSRSDFNGFELEAKLDPEPFGSGESLFLVKPAPALHFKWAKPLFRNVPKTVSIWSLNLPLLSTNGRRRGSIRIYRGYDQANIDMDIDFLTSVFPNVLADALDRSLSGFSVLTERIPGCDRNFADNA